MVSSLHVRLLQPSVRRTCSQQLEARWVLRPARGSALLGELLEQKVQKMSLVLPAKAVENCPEMSHVSLSAVQKMNSASTSSALAPAARSLRPSGAQLAGSERHAIHKALLMALAQHGKVVRGCLFCPQGPTETARVQRSACLRARPLEQKPKPSHADWKLHWVTSLAMARLGTPGVPECPLLLG